MAAIFSLMTESAVRLVGAMVGSSLAHSSREGQGRQRLSSLQEPDRFIESASPFLRSDASMTGKNQHVAIHSAAQFLNESGVECWILPGQIEFADNRAAGDSIVIFLGGENRKSSEDGEGDSGRN